MYLALLADQANKAMGSTVSSARVTPLSIITVCTGTSPMVVLAFDTASDSMSKSRTSIDGDRP